MASRQWAFSVRILWRSSMVFMVVMVSLRPFPPLGVQYSGFGVGV